MIYDDYYEAIDTYHAFMHFVSEQQHLVLGDEDNNEKERDLAKPLSVNNSIVDDSPLNNKDYKPNQGA